jgi:hypothetical protein
MIKSTKVRWAMHAVCMGRREWFKCFGGKARRKEATKKN